MVLEASDGLLLVADGRTSNADGTVRLLDATKIVPVPGSSIGVLLTGRATYGETVVASLCADFLAEECAHRPLPTVERVAVVLSRRFSGLEQAMPGGDTSMVCLVAGYSPGLSTATVARFRVPPAGLIPPTTAFDEQRICTEPEYLCSAALVRDAFVWTIDAVDEEAKRLGLTMTETDDLFAARANAPHRYVNEPRRVLRERLRRELTIAIQDEPDVFVDDLVGGDWSVLELVPGEPAGRPVNLV
jgi:hypothetical protein